jgi:hypothetical protein
MPRFSRQTICSWLAAVAAAGILSACQSMKEESPDVEPPTAAPAANGTQATHTTNQSSLLVAPTIVGKIASANQQAKFAVIMFPIGQVPAVNTRMVVYRGDAKVGEVKITGPTQENITVGDIAVGTAQEGDEVRDH